MMKHVTNAETRVLEFEVTGPEDPFYTCSYINTFCYYSLTVWVPLFQSHQCTLVIILRRKFGQVCVKETQ